MAEALNRKDANNHYRYLDFYMAYTCPIKENLPKT